MSDPKRWFLLIVFGLLFSSGVACSSKPTIETESVPPIQKEITTSSNTLKTKPSHEPLSQAIKKADKLDRQIAYKATITIDINNYWKSRDLLERLTKEVQGYLVNSTERQKQQRLQTGTFTYRIPQKNFQNFINKLKAASFDGEIRQVSIHGEDVTEEMVDLHARLKAKKATEKRLFDLMKKATDSASLIQISQQLDNVQVEIEQIEGRLKYLQNRIDYAEVVITLTQSEIVTAPDDSSMLQKMKETFMKSTKGTINIGKNLLIFLVGLIPVLIFLSIIGAPVYFLVRRWRRKKKNKEDTENKEEQN